MSGGLMDEESRERAGIAPLPEPEPAPMTCGDLLAQLTVCDVDAAVYVDDLPLLTVRGGTERVDLSSSQG